MAGDGAKEGDQVVVVGCVGGGGSCLACWFLERERMLPGREKGAATGLREREELVVAGPPEMEKKMVVVGCG